MPQLTEGKRLADALVPGNSSALPDARARHGNEVIEAAVAAIASAKIHGRKAA